MFGRLGPDGESATMATETGLLGMQGLLGIELSLPGLLYTFSAVSV